MNISLFRLLAELGEDTLGALRVQESDHQVLRTFARSFVDELDTGCLAFSKRFSNVLNIESHVMNATATAILLDELSDSGLRARRLQKLDLHFSDLKESRTDFLILNYFNRITFVP